MPRSRTIAISNQHWTCVSISLARTDARGMFQDRSGKVIKRFHVLIEGRMEGAQLVLDEHFTYSDGSARQPSGGCAKSARAVARQRR